MVSRSASTLDALVAVPVLCACIARLAGQGTVDVRPAFDVVSVKPSDPDARGGVIRPLPGNQAYEVRNASLRAIMTVAYQVTDRQISGGPSWIATDRFDIAAKSGGAHSIDELHQMLQRAVQERFHLIVRRETRLVPIWSLIVDKRGVKMPEHLPADNGQPPMGLDEHGVLAGSNVSMDYLAFTLSKLLDRNVANRTRLAGRYDIHLDSTFWDPAAADAADPVAAGKPDIFRALPDQLGLRLESDKGPVDLLAIQHVEKPSAD